MPKIDPKFLETEYDGITFDEKEIDVLNKILAAKKPIQEVHANFILPVFKIEKPLLIRCYKKIGNFITKPFSISRGSSIFHIKISTGCLGNCSFCTVRKSRGIVQSKTIDHVISEFRDGLNKGFRYFRLLGTDLGSYGRDLGCNLLDLLKEMIQEKGNYKIALRNVCPEFLIEMFEQLRPIFSTGKIFLLATAVESGSDRIL